ncbi:MAG: hypothetical protein WD794_07705 [Mycobacteriales bacterium]
MPASRRLFVLPVLLAAVLAAGPAALATEPATEPTAAADATSRFVPLPPTRVLDTRSGLGAAQAKVAPKGSVVLQVTGTGGIPTSGVTAVVLNVTLTAATGPGFVQVYPTGRATEGSSSNLNVQSVGQTVPVLVTAPVGDGGRVTLYTHGGGHLLADVSGYFTLSGETAAGRYRPLTPARILDTRSGLGAPKGPLGKQQAATVQVTGRGGVPASGVSAVALNVTATGAPVAGFVQVVPSAGSTAAGASSNLNVVARQTVANLVVVPVGDSGAVDVYSSGGTHVLADVAGWFTDDSTAPSGNGLFVPVAPERLLDTRSGSKPGDAAQVQVAPLGRAGIPTSGVSSVVLNVTATLPIAGGFVQVLPTGSGTLGGSSNLNLERPGQTVANAAVATLGEGGLVTLYTLRSTHLLADVAGWFTGPSTSDGALPAELQGLRVAPRSSAPYDAAGWPHWTDADGDCQDTAQEVLSMESIFEATLSGDGCSVLEGLWDDAWTGDQHSSAVEVTVEHLVPLTEAHASGGHAWDTARRQAYANDLAAAEHLLVVGTDVSTDRADRAPDAWQPPLESSRCQYARDWAGVKKRWELSVTQAELDALKAMLGTC